MYKTPKFGNIKLNPIWISDLKYLPVDHTTEVIALDAGGAGSIKSFIGSKIKQSKITSVTYNTEDYYNLVRTIHKNRYTASYKYNILANCITDTTKYQIIINDGSKTLYGCSNPEMSYVRVWINAVQQQLPWVYIWNCISLRSKCIGGGYTSNIGINNMCNVMRQIAENAGYEIQLYHTGIHKSDKVSNMRHMAFYLIKKRNPVPNYRVVNEEVFKVFWQLKLTAPNEVWPSL